MSREEELKGLAEKHRKELSDWTKQIKLEPGETVEYIVIVGEHRTAELKKIRPASLRRNALREKRELKENDWGKILTIPFRPDLIRVIEESRKTGNSPMDRSELNRLLGAKYRNIAVITSLFNPVFIHRKAPYRFLEESWGYAKFFSVKFR